MSSFKHIVAAVSVALASLSAQAAVITSTDVPVAICDTCTVVSTLNVSSHYMLTDVDVLINSLTHTYDQDLILTIIHDGVSVVLANRVGGSGDNFIGTIFDDAAAISISAGAAPFTGSFMPGQSLSAFNGLDAFGLWTLQVSDNVAVDFGSINSWGVNLSGATEVPEPASLALLSLGLAGLAARRRA